MSMTSPMEQVSYDTNNFNYSGGDDRHPLWMTDGHILYHLERDRNGLLQCRKDHSTGEAIRSPRSLILHCVNKLVGPYHDLLVNLHAQCTHRLPTALYPTLLKEAIYNREPVAIETLISRWPLPILKVFDVIPEEDYIEPEYLTLAFEGHGNTCILDCILLGLLKLRPESKLRFVDFTSFEKDRRLCRELARLPILWMKPKERKVDVIHDMLDGTIELSKDKTQRFLNRISVVYSNIDDEFVHGNQIAPLTILLDLKVSMDDIPIGLTLQKTTPFRFVCSKLWLQQIPEVYLPPENISRVLDPKVLTHFEFEDVSLSTDIGKLHSLILLLGQLPSLKALSLPNSVDVTLNQDIAIYMGEVLGKLKNLTRLNLPYCNIKGNVETLLSGIEGQLEYLNLRDCRLMEYDIVYLLNWNFLPGLRELNLSHNNLRYNSSEVLSMLQRMDVITCLSLSFCSLSTTSLTRIIRQCRETGRLKYLCLQSFTPPTKDDMMELLALLARVKTLQRCLIFPEAYAFPGTNDEARVQNKHRMLSFSYKYLNGKDREDLDLE